jgi:hypothetical protein
MSSINTEEDIKFKKQNFIIKKKHTECYKKKLLKTLNKKLYFSIESNKQFKHFFDIIKKEKKEDYLCNLEILFNKYLPISISIEIINKIKNKNDHDIYSIILSELKKSTITTNMNQVCSTNNYIVSKVIKSFLYKYKKKFGNSFFKNKINIINTYNHIYNQYENKNVNTSKNNYTFLNIGDINEDIDFYKKELKIKNENIYQANILDTISKSKYNIELIHTDGHINYTDSFFDFINCGYFLEQISNLSLFISELKRILKKNGYVILYYHDKMNVLDNYLYIIF